MVVRTGNTPNAGTDDPIRFCLGTQCQSLNHANINDRQNRVAEAYTFTIPYTPRASVPYVALETTTGTDAWRPVCLQVVLDGEPLYCREISGLLIGNSTGELVRFEDSALNVNCASCLYGALVGHTTQTSSELWVRAPGATLVHVEYSTDATFASFQQSTAATPDAGADYNVHVMLAGLTAGTTYHYRVVLDGVPFHGAPHPTFTTAPAGPSSFVAAFGSCMDDRDDTAAWAEMPIFNHLAAQNPDLLLLLGDNHYANANLLADRSLWLEELRAHYRKTRTYAPFMQVVSTTPTYAIWDDHDFVGNNTAGADYPVDRATALQAFKEFWANPTYGTGGTNGVWHSFTYGNVEFFMLDNRYWRAAPGGTMLGAQQLAWLTTGLMASTAAFKVVASGSIWHTGAGDSDSWGEHNAERESIIQSIFQSRVNGVIFLGGDIHKAGDWQIPTAVPGGYPLYDFVSSGLAQATTACGAAGSGEVRFACLGGSQYYGLLRFAPDGATPSVTHEIRNAQNAVVFSRQVLLSTLQVP